MYWSMDPSELILMRLNDQWMIYYDFFKNSSCTSCLIYGIIYNKTPDSKRTTYIDNIILGLVLHTAV